MLKRRGFSIIAGIVLVAGCSQTELPSIGTTLAGPVGLAVGCPGPTTAGCAGQPSYLYVTNSNNTLAYRSGSLLAIDLSLIDPTNRSHHIGDVVVDSLEIPNFSGPIELVDVVPGSGGAVPALAISNRLTDEDNPANPDQVFFVHADPAGNGPGLELVDLDAGTDGVQSEVSVGADPFGMAYDTVSGRLYVTNESSGTISEVSLADECERETDVFVPAPCLVDAVTVPEATDPVYTPIDAGNPGDVLLGEVAVGAGITPTENWTVTFVEDPDRCEDGLGFWKVRGQVRGPMTNVACIGVPYTSDGAEIIFGITFDPDVNPPAPPLPGDVFTFSTKAGDFYNPSPIPLSTFTEGVDVRGTGVSQVALDPVSGWLWATSRSSSFVFGVDPALGLPEAVVPVNTASGGFDSRGVVVAPDGSEVYVANRTPDALLVLSPQAVQPTPGPELVLEALIDAVPLGGAPSGLTLTADGSHVLVAAFSDGEVYAVDRASRSVAKTARVGEGPFSIALSPDGSRAFVANYTDGSISVINADPASAGFMQVITTIEE